MFMCVVFYSVLSLSLLCNCDFANKVLPERAFRDDSLKYLFENYIK